MSRITRQRWLSSARGILDKAWTKRRAARDQSPLTRLLRIEPLEDRRLLAITVNTLVDEADGSIVDGDISLRDAIAASPAGGTINFSVTGTINLALGQVNVQNRILEGPGAAQLTINANELSRVFQTRGTTTIAGMTITGGKNLSFQPGGGGGIRHEIFGGDAGHLTVRDCVITGNTALLGGGIYGAGYVGNFPSVTVVNSTISNNTAVVGVDPNTARGGGIYAYLAALTVDKSTISGNSAGKVNSDHGRGGGIYGNLTTVTNSTISGNSASAGDGFFGTGTISNSTISGNDRDGLYLRGGAVANSTITGNAPGIRTNGGVTLTNSIVAGNLGADIAGPLNVAASRNNLIGSKDLYDDPFDNLPPIGPPAGGLTNGVNGNLVDFAEPGLGPLANNGGPTQTHALWSFSPAINAGDNSLVPINPSTGLPFTTDQTGAARIFNGGTVDMGAYELQATPATPSLVVNTATDDVAANSLTSLREAVGFARTLGGVVTFDPTVFATPQTIALVHGQVQVDGAAVPVTIAGPGASLATVDAGGASRVFKTVGTTTISGLTITGAVPQRPETFGYGAIFNDKGTLTVQNCVITGNATNGIHNYGALTVSNSTISHNTATLSKGGGGIRSGVGDNDDSVVATISDSIIDGNVAPPGSNQGGGIFANGTLTITNSTISGNTGSFGGGIEHSSANGTLTISNSTISGNSASQGGGGINHFGTSIPTIINSTISGNSASQGGGIDSSALLINSTISGNSARIGGGMWGYGAIVNSTIANNTATYQGGGLFSSESTTIILNSIVAGNRLNGTPSDVHNSLNPASAYSLIGDAATAGGLMNSVNGNIVGANPALVFGPLADNGGPTLPGGAKLLTHALLVGSPAIDAGDPLFIPGGGFLGLNPIYDQRGPGFARVIGNAIDIGAFERQTPELVGDYNRNDKVDAADYVLWRKTAGTTGVPAFFGADGDGNSAIATNDYNVWRAHFGQSLPGAGTGASNASQPLAAAASTEVATAAPNETATTEPITANEDSDPAPNLAKPAVRSELDWFADAVRSSRVRARQDATTTSTRADAMPHDNGLLAWLSSRPFAQSPLAEEIGSSRHSSEDANQSDGSDADSVDEFFAGVVRARLFDF